MTFDKFKLLQEYDSKVIELVMSELAKTPSVICSWIKKVMKFDKFKLLQEYDSKVIELVMSELAKTPSVICSWIKNLPEC